VQLLRQHDTYCELIVFPDDTHEPMLYSRWLCTLDRMAGSSSAAAALPVLGACVRTPCVTLDVYETHKSCA
jgi:hypothetical protein